MRCPRISRGSGYLSGSAGSTVGGGGGYAHGDLVTITGTGFGTKAVAKPFLWAPFDSSINPSPLGRKTSWDLIEYMAYAAGEGIAGGALKSLVAGNNPVGDGGTVWTAGAWTTGYGFSWNDAGQKFYLFRRNKRSFDIDHTLNYKTLRLWSANQTYPNWYLSHSNGGWNCEDIAGVNSFPYGSYGDQVDLDQPNAQIIAARGSANVWRSEEFLTQANSSNALADGSLKHYVVGYGLAAQIPFHDYADHYFKIKDDTWSAAMVECFAAHDILDAGIYAPSDWTVWYDDIYLDNTWARVMLGNSVTYSACTFLAPQPPTAWSDTSVTVSLNLAGFPSGSTRYLHVLDDTNTVRQTTSIGVHP